MSVKEKRVLAALGVGRDWIRVSDIMGGITSVKVRRWEVPGQTYWRKRKLK